MLLEQSHSQMCGKGWMLRTMPFYSLALGDTTHIYPLPEHKHSKGQESQWDVMLRGQVPGAWSTTQQGRRGICGDEVDTSNWHRSLYFPCQYQTTDLTTYIVFWILVSTSNPTRAWLFSVMQRINSSTTIQTQDNDLDQNDSVYMGEKSDLFLHIFQK